MKENTILSISTLMCYLAVHYKCKSFNAGKKPPLFHNTCYGYQKTPWRESEERKTILCARGQHFTFREKNSKKTLQTRLMKTNTHPPDGVIYSCHDVFPTYHSLEVCRHPPFLLLLREYLWGAYQHSCFFS